MNTKDKITYVESFILWISTRLKHPNKGDDREGLIKLLQEQQQELLILLNSNSDN